MGVKATIFSCTQGLINMHWRIEACLWYEMSESTDQKMYQILD